MPTRIAGRVPPAHAAPPPHAQAPHVLVVDDEVKMQRVLEIMLDDMGLDVLRADNGQAALDLVMREQVDLIITDINMPKMDGIEFAKRVKASAHKFTPILMITTESRSELKAEGRAAGVRGWIVKPFQPSQLLEAVNKLRG